MENIVIVGASLAGAQAAQTLRRSGFGGSLTLVGDERHRPYDRPPLSKGYLAGTVDDDRLWLRSVADPDALDLQLRLGNAATSLRLWSAPGGSVSGGSAAAGSAPGGSVSGDADGRSHAGVVDPVGDIGGEVVLTDGSTLAFDGLVIATGARARELPGQSEIAGVHVLRGLDDARILRQALTGGAQNMVVIGCGFVGTEVAATAREQGLHVALVDAASAPLSRVLNTDGGMAVADLHRSHGVDVHLGVGVARLVSEASPSAAVTAVELTTGEVLPADIVVVGIGVAPNTEWLQGSGLTLDDGVVVDEHCVAAPGVVAAGDVARWPQRRFGGRLARVEQWDNAVEMGAHAAKNLLALANGEPPTVFDPVPWFWSDQYDRKIQLAGIPSPHSEVVWGSLDDQKFVQVYLDVPPTSDDNPTSGDDGDPNVVGVLTWNRPRQAILGRQLIAEGATLSQARHKLA